MPELQWEEVAKDMWQARDGRYLVQLEKAGWVARVYQESKLFHEFPPTSVVRYAKQHCLAVEVGVLLGDLMSLERTAEHEPISYEVVDGEEYQNQTEDAHG